MNGGYVMFDASVLDLDNGGTLSGLYNKMQELFNSGKPLLLCNVKYSTYTLKAMFVSFVLDDTTYRLGWIDDSGAEYFSIGSDDSYTGI